MNLKTNEDYINEAIDCHLGDVRIGDIVTHRSHRLAHTLVGIVGNTGICKLPDSTINNFPLNELFDPNKVKHTASNNKIIDGLRVDNTN